MQYLSGSLLLAAAIALPGAANAQQSELGKQLYEEHCVSCHGAAGRGEGWLTKYLTRPTPALDGLAKNAHGVFPADEVRSIIDGRAETQAHGPREMPVWGAAFKQEFARREVQPPASVSPAPAHFPPPSKSEGYVRESIDALLAYLAGIQRP